MKPLAWEAGEASVPATPDRSALRLEVRRLPAAERGAAVVAPPHPLYGGTFHNPVVIGIVEGLARAGASSWTFNWRGTEGSEGSKTDSLEAAVSDYRAVFHALAGSGVNPPLYAAGYSFGAATALLAASEESRIEGLVLVAPPVGMLREADLSNAPRRVLVLVGSDDEYAELASLEAKLAVRGDVELEVIAGADHFFHFGGLAEIAPRIAARIARW